MKLKKILILFLSSLLLLSLVACNEQSDGPGKIKKEEKTITLFDASGENDYTIVYATNATEEVKTMVKDLQGKIKDVTGNNPTYTTDTSKKVAESEREIVIGKTTRDASTQSLAKITEASFRIEFVGDKLVITASNDALLEKAIEKLYTLWTVDGSSIRLSNLTEAAESFADAYMPLSEADGSINYRIVIPNKKENGYTKELEEAANCICTLFENYMTDIGKKTDEKTKLFQVCLDDQTPDDGSVPEILLGNTNRQISRELYSGLENVFEYQIRKSGSTIAVGALISSELVKGVTQLTSDLSKAIDSTYSGIPMIKSDFGGVFTSSSIAKGLVLPTAGTLATVGDCGKDSFILYYKAVGGESAYTNYIDTLKKNGCTVKETYTMGENAYTLLHHNTYTAYVSYLSSDKAIRLYVGSPDDLNPPTDAVKDAKKVKPSIWQLDINNDRANTDGGMSYVIQLSDGKFLVVDGGFSYNGDCDNIYDLLMKNKPASDPKPVIAGWFITHLHGDHHGAVIGFAAQYADAVTVEAFYYNFPYVPMGTTQTTSPTSAVDAERAMKSFKGAKLYRKVHSGMNFQFSGATVTILCTFEDVYPSSHGDGNDTSTTFRVDIGGQRILFVGDAMTSESLAMQKLGADVMKADILQYSHHGYEGCTLALYKLVDPSVVLWPMAKYVHNSTTALLFAKYYEGKFAGIENSWVRDSDSVKKVYFSGLGNVRLILPYTPTGEKIGSYK